MSEKKAEEIVRLLAEQHPEARIELDYKTPLDLLVATILSAQCTDKRVNLVTKDLFRKYKTAEDYARAGQKGLEKEIKSTGFYRNKAKNIIAMAKKLVADYGGKVPDSMQELLTLPGVARKTANVVLGEAFGKAEGIAVDTHVKRVSFRLGLTKNTDPVKIEQDLMKEIPKKHWIKFTMRMVLHGRYVCTAKNPDCEACLLSKVCPSAFKV